MNAVYGSFDECDICQYYMKKVVGFLSVIIVLFFLNLSIIVDLFRVDIKRRLINH